MEVSIKAGHVEGQRGGRRNLEGIVGAALILLMLFSFLFL